jgi:hypothetical protein
MGVIDTPDLLAHLIAVEVGQHEVQQDALRSMTFDQLQCFSAARAVNDFEAFKLQRIAQTHGETRIVFDQQNGLGWRVAWRAHVCAPEAASFMADSSCASSASLAE